MGDDREGDGRHRDALMARWLDRWPARCALCGAWPARPLCEDCVARFARPVARCGRCAILVPDGIRTCGACLRQPPPWQQAVAAVTYAWPWIDAIARLKFAGDAGWARPLAALLASAPGADDLIDRSDRVLPLPLSPARLSQRGFNQSLLLARALQPRKTDATLLLRVRDTPAQHALPRAERLRNVEGAYAVEPLRAAELRDRRLLLLDDVMTSGASLGAAARCLLDAGAAAVDVLVFARTEAGQ